MKTEQEAFWAGEFGDDYVDRNQGNDWIAGYISNFSDITRRLPKLNSIIEFGCNRGMNLQALRHLFPNASLSGIEINQKACEEAKKLNLATIYNDSIIDTKINEKHDLAFIKGVLIHINPDHLKEVYKNIYNAAGKYICISEYYSPNPVELPYRGHSEKLFKRDFAGEMLDLYPDLKLIDYGFTYHRDPKYTHDDMNWFLMEK